MKNKALDEHSSITSHNKSENIIENNSKTTNINILLNRVKLDKKKDLRKKVVFLSLLFSVLIVVAIFALI
ncbi:hypothetical protein N9419_06060 [Candidatus Pelagibacter sp.]|jgi:hypothetical protein|nr:hypothetical protein [Candidatus Pelagibacter sp.]